MDDNTCLSLLLLLLYSIVPSATSIVKMHSSLEPSVGMCEVIEQRELNEI